MTPIETNDMNGHRGNGSPGGDFFMMMAGVLILRWKTILTVTLAAGILTAGLSLLLPNRYRATARVLPPAASSLNPISAALSRNLPSAATTLLGGGRNDYERYLTILTSRRMYEAAVDSFSLVEVYDVADADVPREAAMEKLMKYASFEISDEYNYLAVSVLDVDPKRAAAMSNYFVSELNRINASLSSQNAAKYRVFVEGRYNGTMARLDSSLNRLQAFQKQYGLYDVPAQTQAYFQQLARLRSEVVLSEIQFESLRSQLGADNAQVNALKDVVNAANRQYEGALSGTDRVMPVPQGSMSTVMRTYLNLERDRLIQTRLLEVVGPLLEQARFEEEREVVAVQVVDDAVPPSRKFTPRRSFIVLYVMASVLMLTVLYLCGIFLWRHNHGHIVSRIQRSVKHASQTLS